MITKVVIDTNVIVSALLFGGKPGNLITLWKHRVIIPFVTKEIVDEYLRVLTYPKFELTEKEIQYLLYQQILPYFNIVEAKPGNIILQSDPSDDKFIRCAMAGTAYAVISGDSHLLSLKKYRNTPIVTPSQFLNELIKKS